MQEVELSPGQRSFWLRSGIHCIRLHAANISSKNNISLWVLAAFAGERRSAQPGKDGNRRSPTHVSGSLSLVQDQRPEEEMRAARGYISLESACRRPAGSKIGCG
jgi:hypothetical protein